MLTSSSVKCLLVRKYLKKHKLRSGINLHVNFLSVYAHNSEFYVLHCYKILHYRDFFIQRTFSY